MYAKNDIVEIRGIKIDKTARRVWVNGEEKTFTSKEYDLLTFLAENPNRVFTKEELFRESGIWNLWEILQQSLSISRRSGRKLNLILQNLSILKQSGA